MSSSIYLSLGSNLGDRKVNLEKAIGKLREKGIQVVQASSIYETEPVDVPDQPYFLNLVCQVKTEVEPETLLKVCQDVESEMHRVREKSKGPRNIDIDIIFYDQRIVEKPLLKIPHPAWYRRNFVLIPLQEIAPDFQDPVTEKTVQQLQSESPDRARVTFFKPALHGVGR